MSRSFSYPERVPANAVERLLVQFDALVDAVDAAASATPDEVHAVRLGKAHTLLLGEQGRLLREAESFKANEPSDLLGHAWDLRRLARNMDGRSVEAAGDELAQKVVVAQQLVVLTAWQISAAASGSEAAGL